METAKWDFLSRLISIKKAVESKRHLTRGTTYQKRNSKFHIFLDFTETHPDSLNDEQFLFHFRVCRKTFAELLILTKNHPVFQRSHNGSDDEEDPGPDQLEGGIGNDRRRSELFHCLSELKDTNIN